MNDPRWILAVPAVAAFGVDVTLTLLGQSPQYWNGEYFAANEGAPVGLFLLRMHPTAFLFGAWAYAAGVSTLIRYLPHALALWLSLGFLIAHTSGVNSWLYSKPYWEPVHNTIGAALAAYCYAIYFRFFHQQRVEGVASEETLGGSS